MPARVSFYRPTGQSRRQARQHTADHDVFEGLPIRRWTKQWVPYGRKTLGPPAPPELPLPKETHLLTPMSQALLQAARAGTLDKPKQPQTVQPGQQLFETNRWTMVPRDMEPSEPSYLGKLPDIPRKRKRIRKRVDGKIVVTYIEDGPAEVGHAIPRHVAPQAPVPRRRQPPKRKPGRGRKPGRKVKFVDEMSAQHPTVGVVAAAEGAGGEPAKPESDKMDVDKSAVVEASAQDAGKP